jgi:hypothetical protein
MIDMGYISLIRIRDTLSLSAFKAAYYFGSTDTETWLKWESNEESVPNPVTIRVNATMTRYRSLCELVTNAYRKEGTIKNVYGVIAEAINGKAEHQCLEHKLAQQALNSVITFSNKQPQL